MDLTHIIHIIEIPKVLALYDDNIQSVQSLFKIDFVLTFILILFSALKYGAMHHIVTYIL